jgi:RNA-directed DNA polymerase
MESAKVFLEKKLKLKVNSKKSKVDRASRVKFLGFSFFKRNGEVLIRIANRSKGRFIERLRRLTKRTRSGKLEDVIQGINPYTIGWIGYCRLANTPSVFEG